MHNWQFVNVCRRTTLAAIGAGLLTTALAAPGFAAEGELDLPAYDGSSFSSSDTGFSSSGAPSAGPGASGTVTPEVVYSNQDYYPTDMGGGYASGGVGYSELLGAHLRARYNTRSYGQTRGNLDIGSMKLYDQGDSAWFIDGQVALNDVNPWGYNVGVGYRFLTLPLLPNSADSEKLAGVSFWTDGMMTENDNFLPQLGVSLEYLGEYWDLRGNLYVPIAEVEVGEFNRTGDIAYADTFLVQEIFAGADEALTVTEIEAARRIGELEAWGFVGGYGLYGDDTDTAGYKIGLRGYATPDISVQLAITDDDVFGTNAVFSGTWFIGRTRTNTPCRSPVAMRMREPVLRNDYVAVRQRTITDGTVLRGDIDGDGVSEPIRVVHVDSTAADGGDGSIDAPLNQLADINGSSSADSIILVHSGSTFGDGVTLDAAVLKGGQRLLGEGGGVDHTVATTRFGTISLPESSTGASAGAVPTITNPAGGGDVIRLANETLEVTNFAMTGGTRAIVAPSGNTRVTLSMLDISGTTGNGVELSPGTELATAGVASSQRVRFTPTITDVTFANIGGDDINLDGTAPVVLTTTPLRSITISDVTSTGGAGVGINMANITGGSTIRDYSHDGGGVATGGIVLNNVDGAVAATNVTIANEAGFGISMIGNDVGHQFTNVDITDTTGAAFRVSGGTQSATTTTNFTGTITQSQNAAAVLFENGAANNGTYNFTEATTGDGVVNATNGAGLVFNNSNSTVRFNSGVTLNGGDAGIDITGGDADITVSDGTITNPSGAAVMVDGGSSGLNFTGTIAQSNNVSTVSVTGGHTGTLFFNEATAGGGVITSTNGDGLQFNDADGGYFFDAVTLNGGDAGIDIFNNSAGNFNFATGSAITNPTGDAFTINASTATVTYNGTIDNNSGFAASVTGNMATSNVIFGGQITDTSMGVQVLNNTGGSYSFTGGLDLDTGVNNAVTVANNTNTTLIRFDNVQINTTTGGGFVVADSAGLRVSGSGNTIETTTGTALSITDSSVAGAGVTFDSVSVNGAANGIVMNNVTGGPVFIGLGGATAGDGGTIQNTTGAGVSLTNVADVSINFMQITGSGTDGVEVVHNNATASTVAINNSLITGSGARGIDVSNTGSGVFRVTVDGNTINTSTAESVAIDAGAGAGASNITVSNNDIQNTSSEEAVLITGNTNTLNILIDGNTQLSTNIAGGSAASLIASGSATFNTTVTDNSFVNPNATGQPLTIESASGSSLVRLLITGNTANGGGSDGYFMINNSGGTFDIVDLNTVGLTPDDVNSGDAFNYDPNIGSFGEEMDTIPTP